MPAISYIPTYTIADYLTWKGDWELWNGVAVAMSSPRSRHQRLARRAVTALDGSLTENSSKSKPCEHCEVFYELDWHVDDLNVVRPDIALTCTPVGDFITSAPALIVEVLSDSTRDKDLGPKRELYAQQGVRHYLVIDPKTDQLLLWSNGNWAPCQDDVLSLDLDDRCTTELPVTPLFA